MFKFLFNRREFTHSPTGFNFLWKIFARINKPQGHLSC